jgi:hypothetical protein
MCSHRYIRTNQLVLTAAVVAIMCTVGCSDNEATPPTDQTDTDTPVAGDQSDAPPEDELPVPYQQLMTDRLVDADYWQEEPAILAAGLGFTNINGVPGLSDPNLSLTEIEAMVRDAGAGWHNVTSTAPVDEIDLRARTPAASLSGITQLFGYPSPNGDGLPMELSHPVLASTVHREDIAVYLNTGEVITPDNISVMPNGEYNERSTLVMNGAFGNRLNPTDPNAVYPVQFEIVGSLQLMTPNGAFEAKGLAFGEGATPLTAYRPGQGPRLCAAKLTMADAGLAGEGAPGNIQSGSFPNDLRSLYGDSADYRLRVLTTGGVSPNGVRSLYPNEYSDFFRVGLRPAGIDVDNYDAMVWLENIGETVTLEGFGQLTVLGLAELGIAASSYDDSYIEDHDNQIDIVLAGDRAAAERVAVVHIPATPPYKPFYNPGGPGSDPDSATVYSEPGPEYFQAVTIALDDPMQVSFEP